VQVITGVRCTLPEIRFAACLMSSIETMLIPVVRDSAMDAPWSPAQNGSSPWRVNMP